MSKVVMYECQNCNETVRETASDTDTATWLFRRKFKQHHVDFCSAVCEGAWLNLQAEDPTDWRYDRHVMDYCARYDVLPVVPEELLAPFIRAAREAQP